MKRNYLFFLILLWSYQVGAQTNLQLKKLIAKADSINLKPEKIYLQFDRDLYFQGDTAYFKAYVFDAAFLRGSTKSGLIYIELSDRNNDLVKRQVFSLTKGIGAGQLYFNANELSEGAYIIRAYTNWNRNFGEDYVFQKSFYLSKPIPPQWLVNIYPSILSKTANNLLFHIKKNSPNLDPLALKDIQLKASEGERDLITLTTKTDDYGAFNLPVKLNQVPRNGLIFELEEPGKLFASLKVPINLLPDIDLQFMPESGQLIAGFKTKIGFKAIGIDGYGLDVKGKILDRLGQPVAVFETLHKGIGSFELMPKEGEQYKAVINVFEKEMSYDLPSVKTTGISLAVTNLINSDILTIAIRSNVVQQKNFYLIGEARGIVCYAKSIGMKTDHETMGIPKKDFPSGIAKFTILTIEGKPLSERCVFIDHNDNLNIQLDTSRYVMLGDSVRLDLHVATADGLPIQGTFSFAATAQNLNDKLNPYKSNLLNLMLLSSDLKGNIEQPGYYLEKEAWEALDNLLLTQGWKGFDWNELTKPLKRTKFDVEKYYAIKGTAMNAFGKPLPKVEVLLLSRKPEILIQTLTDERGKFEFIGLPEIDTPIIRLEAKNRRGKNFNIRIEPELFQPPRFTAYTNFEKPWYLTVDSSKATTIPTDRIAYYNPNLAGQMLKEVTIKSQKLIKGSQSHFGRRRTDNVYTEKDLEVKPKSTLYEFIMEKLPQFYTKVDMVTGKRTMMLDYPVSISFDGIDVDSYWDNFDEVNDHFSFMKVFLDMYSAEDVKGIEVMRRGYSTIIEITTKDGQGPYLRKTPGVIIFKPVSLQAPIAFYTPKYQPNLTDQTLKPTMFWIPDLRTDINGNATISFYKNPNITSFHLTIEGTDLLGNIGSLSKTFIQPVKSN